MPVTRAHAKATSKWESKALDKICLRIRKDGELTRDKITAAATDANESINQYILKAIEERMERQKRS